MITISEQLRRGREAYRTHSTIVYEGSTLEGRVAADAIDELCAALERMVDEQHDPSGAAVRQAHAALAKAKGKAK